MCVFRHLDVHVVSRPAPEHRGKYARMPRKQICREFPLHSSALQTPMIMHPWHGTEATAAAPPAATIAWLLPQPPPSPPPPPAAAPQTSNSLQTKGGEGGRREGATAECSWSGVRVASVRPSPLPPLSLCSPLSPEGNGPRVA